MGVLKKVFHRNLFLSVESLCMKFQYTSNYAALIESNTALQSNGVDSIHNNSEKLGKSSVLDTNLEDVSDYAPYHSPSFNFAAYVNKSPTLMKLVDLGVDLNKLEQKKGVPEKILRLDYERDIVNYIHFLGDLGVETNSLGHFITKNPWIFSQDIEDLQVRVCYLKMKKFSAEGITRVITKNPVWLNYKTQDIDKRLGYFQSSFKLCGDEVRFLAVKMPKIITYNLQKIEGNIFAVREEMGFSNPESKLILLKKPKIYTLCRSSLVSRFTYIHRTMGIPHAIILQQLGGLVSREARLKERHEFLVSLGKAQFDPSLPGYVSLEDIVSGNDSEFCKNIAGTSVATYNLFLKSL